MLYAVVKKYEQNGEKFADWHYKPSDREAIYEKILKLLGNNIPLAINISSWAELATEGEIYEFENGEVEILDIY